MDFSKLFLGYNEVNEFINLAIRENYITDYIEEYDGDFDDVITQAKISRINHKSTLLRLLLLFDNIDANRLMGYNVDRLIDIGLISKDPVLNSIGFDKCNAEGIIQGKLNLLDMKNPPFESLLVGLILRLDKECETNFFESFTTKEIKDMAIYIHQGNMNKLKKFLLESDILYLLAEGIMVTEWFGEILLKKFGESPYKLAVRIAKEKISKYILEPITIIILQDNIQKISNNTQIVQSFSLLDDLYTIKGKKQCKMCNYRKTTECLGYFHCEYAMGRYVTLLDIFTSINQKVPVYSRYLKTDCMDSMLNIKIVDDIYYLFKLPELRQLNSLPSPKSLTEALRLRNRPEIISFRNIFRSWCEELQNFGDTKTIELITKDFNKASNYLNEQYKKYDKQKKPVMLFGKIL